MEAASMAMQFLSSDLRESLIGEHLLAEIFIYSGRRKRIGGAKKGLPGFEANRAAHGYGPQVRNRLNFSGSTCGQAQLPGEAQTNLLVAHWQRNVGDLSRQRRARNTPIALSYVAARIRPVGHVQRIENFPPQL